VAPDRLLLPAGALTEVQLAFRPLVPGRLDVMIHLVDLERRELVHSRLACTDARAPTVGGYDQVVNPVDPYRLKNHPVNPVDL
jgi:hypothetical protein